jgi:hypothetical protein
VPGNVLIASVNININYYFQWSGVSCFLVILSKSLIHHLIEIKNSLVASMFLYEVYILYILTYL